MIEQAIQEVKSNGSRILYIGGKSYTIGSELGSGSNGTSYKCVDEFGKLFAIKEIHKQVYTDFEIRTFLKEAIIQILLAEESKHEAEGPYVPMLYTVGYNWENNHAFIVSELMRNTFSNLISALSEEENDIVVPNAIQQVATMIDFFGKRLKFNHRDLKSDNIMYIRRNNIRLFRLIDFGFSCLTWNGLKINGGEYFSPVRTCFRKERDLMQFIYQVWKYDSQFYSRGLTEWLKNMLVVNMGNKTCDLGNGCEIDHIKIMKEWRETYNFFNRSNVTAPYGDPQRVIKKMNNYINKNPFHIVEPVAKDVQPVQPVKTDRPVCPPGKIYNRKTRRCVKTTGKTGMALIKEADIPLANVLLPHLPPGVLEESVKKCPPEKIYNKKTRRCVKADGFAGKAIARAAVPPLPIPPRQGFPILPPRKDPLLLPIPQEEQKPCPPNKVYNKKTRRCVKMDGWAGKRVLEGK